MLRRFRMILRGLLARRSRPDLGALAAETDPERFVWGILPHAARSFAASIVVLPTAESRVAAVAYLYARMLDTYEDLIPDHGARVAALGAFAARFETAIPAEPPLVEDMVPLDESDRLHVLLVERAVAVDSVFVELPEPARRQIASLIGSMAEGMIWSSERFAHQGGTLKDDEQLFRYCHHVIGHPAAFTIDLLTDGCAAAVEDRNRAVEMLQLANITRDLEKDLLRGVAYDPHLRPHLGTRADDAVKVVRERLLGLALARADSYRRMYLGVDLRRRPGARMAAVLMLLFTDLHYRRMAELVGWTPWPGPDGKTTITLAALPSLISTGYAERMIARVADRLARQQAPTSVGVPTPS